MEIRQIIPIITLRQTLLMGAVCVVFSAFAANEAAAGMISAVGMGQADAAQSMSGSRRTERPIPPRADEDDEPGRHLAADVPTNSSSSSSSVSAGSQVNAAAGSSQVEMPQQSVTYLARQRSRVLRSPPHDAGLFRPPRA